MICPHCKKPIDTRVTDAALKRARKLRKEGHSLRDIERILIDEGYRASFSTLSRKLKEPAP
jgi:hypothetical protein